MVNKEDIIRMAEHAGFGMPVQVFQFRAEELERFAALIAAAEREACAKTCEEKKSKYDERVSKSEDERNIDPEVARIAKMTCDFNAAAIRARGET